MRTGILLLLGTVASAQEGWLTYRSDRFGIEFRYPAQFAVGAYKPHIPAPENAARMREMGLPADPFEDYVVLIEKRLTGRFPLKEIPVGEVATIGVEPRTGHRVDFDRRQFAQAKYRVEIGGHTVQRLPGFPGPYGDAAFCYIVFLRQDLTLWLTAHRKYIDRTRADTHYDRIVEQIITTLRSTR